MKVVNENLFGCFVSGPSIDYDASQKEESEAEEKGRVFRGYIWGNDGLDNVLKKLVNIEYGNDIHLVLFQFILNPLPMELEGIKEVEPYRKKEKAIGVNIIVDDDNFFNKTHVDRVSFIKAMVLKRIRVLKQNMENSEIDTRFDLVERELNSLF